MTHDEGEAFAARWAGWWNTGDVEKVLEHFHHDVVFTSPTALDMMGTATVRGKDALRAYWTSALQRVGTVRFAVDRTLWDPTRRELAIIYTAEMAGRRRRVSENLTFGENDQVMAAEVFHGVGGPI